MENETKEVVAVTMKDRNPSEYERLKNERRKRKSKRLAGLKALGFKPNNKLTRDKKSGQDLKDVRT